MTKTKDYDVNDYFEVLGYQPASLPYYCKGLRSLAVICRGQREQLDELLAPTPFETIDDRFVVSVSMYVDTTYADGSTSTYGDSSIVLAARYGDQVGAMVRFEYESTYSSVLAGRQKWGYPKDFALVELDDDETRACGRAYLPAQPIVDVELTFDDSAPTDVWDGFPRYPHLLVKASPEPDGDSFDSFEILARDTSDDYVLSTAKYGYAEVKFGPSVSFRGRQLEVVEPVTDVHLLAHARPSPFFAMLRAHRTRGSCSGSRPMATAFWDTGRRRQSTAILTLAGKTPTKKAAVARAAALRVRGSATAAARASSAAPLA